MQNENQRDDKVPLSICAMVWSDFGAGFAKAVSSNLEISKWGPGDLYAHHLHD